MIAVYIDAGGKYYVTKLDGTDNSAASFVDIDLNFTGSGGWSHIYWGDNHCIIPGSTTDDNNAFQATFKKIKYSNLQLDTTFGDQGQITFDTGAAFYPKAVTKINNYYYAVGNNFSNAVFAYLVRFNDSGLDNVNFVDSKRECTAVDGATSLREMLVLNDFVIIKTNAFYASDGGFLFVAIPLTEIDQGLDAPNLITFNIPFSNYAYDAPMQKYGDNSFFTAIKNQIYAMTYDSENNIFVTDPSFNNGQPLSVFENEYPSGTFVSTIKKFGDYLIVLTPLLNSPIYPALAYYDIRNFNNPVLITTTLLDSQTWPANITAYPLAQPLDVLSTQTGDFTFIGGQSYLKNMGTLPDFAQSGSSGTSGSAGSSGSVSGTSGTSGFSGTSGSSSGSQPDNEPSLFENFYRFTPTRSSDLIITNLHMFANQNTKALFSIYYDNAQGNGLTCIAIKPDGTSSDEIDLSNSSFVAANGFERQVYYSSNAAFIPGYASGPTQGAIIKIGMFDVNGEVSPTIDTTFASSGILRFNTPVGHTFTPGAISYNTSDDFYYAAGSYYNNAEEAAYPYLLRFDDAGTIDTGISNSAFNTLLSNNNLTKIYNFRNVAILKDFLVLITGPNNDNSVNSNISACVAIKWDEITSGADATHALVEMLPETSRAFTNAVAQNEVSSNNFFIAQGNTIHCYHLDEQNNTISVHSGFNNGQELSFNKIELSQTIFSELAIQDNYLYAVGKARILNTTDFYPIVVCYDISDLNEPVFSTSFSPTGYKLFGENQWPSALQTYPTPQCIAFFENEPAFIASETTIQNLESHPPIGWYVSGSGSGVEEPFANFNDPIDEVTTVFELGTLADFQVRNDKKIVSLYTKQDKFYLTQTNEEGLPEISPITLDINASDSYFCQAAWTDTTCMVPGWELYTALDLSNRAQGKVGRYFTNTLDVDISFGKKITSNSGTTYVGIASLEDDQYHIFPSCVTQNGEYYYVGGTITSLDYSTMYPYLARLTQDGSVDETFVNTAFNDNFYLYASCMEMCSLSTGLFIRCSTSPQNYIFLPNASINDGFASEGMVTGELLHNFDTFSNIVKLNTETVLIANGGTIYAYTYDNNTIEMASSFGDNGSLTFSYPQQFGFTMPVYFKSLQIIGDYLFASGLTATSEDNLNYYPMIACYNILNPQSPVLETTFRTDGIWYESAPAVEISKPYFLRYSPLYDSYPATSTNPLARILFIGADNFIKSIGNLEGVGGQEGSSGSSSGSAGTSGSSHENSGTQGSSGSSGSSEEEIDYVVKDGDYLVAPDDYKVKDYTLLSSTNLIGAYIDEDNTYFLANLSSTQIQDAQLITTDLSSSDSRMASIYWDTSNCVVGGYTGTPGNNNFRSVFKKFNYSNLEVDSAFATNGTLSLGAGINFYPHAITKIGSYYYATGQLASNTDSGYLVRFNNSGVDTQTLTGNKRIFTQLANVTSFDEIIVLKDYVVLKSNSTLSNDIYTFTFVAIPVNQIAQGFSASGLLTFTVQSPESIISNMVSHADNGILVGTADKVYAFKYNTTKRRFITDTEFNNAKPLQAPFVLNYRITSIRKTGDHLTMLGVVQDPYYYPWINHYDIRNIGLPTILTQNDFDTWPDNLSDIPLAQPFYTIDTTSFMAFDSRIKVTGALPAFPTAQIPVNTNVPITSAVVKELIKKDKNIDIVRVLYTFKPSVERRRMPAAPLVQL